MSRNEDIRRIEDKIIKQNNYNVSDIKIYMGFTFSFFTSDSIARLLKPSLSPP